MMSNEWRFVSKIAYIRPDKQGNAENNIKGIRCGRIGRFGGCGGAGGLGQGGMKSLGGLRVAEVLVDWGLRRCWEIWDVAEVLGGLGVFGRGEF